MRYRAYRLLIDSEVEFPELLPVEPDPPAGESAGEPVETDIRVRFGRASRETSILDDGGNGIWTEGDQACHYRRGTGHCLVTGGREIVFEAEGDPDPALVRLALLGPALSLALMQRGLFLMHASAVAFRDSDDAEFAVAFLGVHGSGKSTMAAALHARGWPLVTDDVVAIEHTTGDVRVLPSFPQLKLWSKSAEELGLDAAEMPLVHPDFDKFAWRPDEARAGMADDPLPLRRLYVLGLDEEIKIEKMEPQLASQYVMRNWYGARFGESYFQSLDVGQHFKRCIELTTSVPSRRLMRPKVHSGFAPLTEQVEKAILEDLNAE